MKKIYAVAIASSMTLGVMAQQKVAEPIGQPIEGKLPVSLEQFQGEAANDTLAGPILGTCLGQGPFLIGSTNGGYLNGTNGYGDVEKAQAFVSSQMYGVTSALVLFGAKENVIGGNLYAYVYSFDTATGGPGTLLGTSSPVTLSAVDTSLNFTTFSFPTPVLAGTNGAFFISILVETGGDTVGILHTNDLCGGGSAWEKWDVGTWASIASGWNLDITSYIFAEVDNTFDIEESNILGKNEAKAFPNPTTEGHIFLTYNTVAAGSVNIRIMDLAGRVHMNLTEDQNAGRQLIDLNTSELNKGTYIYTIQSGDAVYNGKFIVKN